MASHGIALRQLTNRWCAARGQLWQLHQEKRALRKSHLDHWEATVARTGTGRPVDAILSPAVAYAACPHGCNTCVPASNLSSADFLLTRSPPPLF